MAIHEVHIEVSEKFCNKETCLHLQPRFMLRSTSPLRFKHNWLNLPIVGYLETLVPFLKYLRISRRLCSLFNHLRL